MKTPDEIRNAIATLGAAVTDTEFTEYMWGGPASEPSTRAMFMLLTLGWVMDADPEMFDGILTAIESKRQEFEKEKSICLKQMSLNRGSQPSSRHPHSN